MPQSISAIGADAFDVVQHGLCISFVRPLPVIGDDEAVGLIAKKLEKLQRRFVVVQHDGHVASFYIDFLDALGETDDRRRAAGLADHRDGSAHLSQTAVQDDEVRLGPILFVSIAATHDFGHGFEIVGVALGGAEFEFPILTLRRAAVFKDRHGTGGLGALVMRNIEALHPLRQAGQAQKLFQLFHSPLLAGILVLPLQLFIGQIFRRIGHGHVLQPPLEAALGEQHFHFAASKLCEPIFQQTFFFRQQRQNNFLRHGSGILPIEIAEEGDDDFLITFRAAIRDAEIFLPHHAAVADIKNFQPCVTAISGKAHHVEVAVGTDDVLPLLHTLDGFHLIPQLSGLFEIQIFRSRQHFFLQLFHQRRAFPFQQGGDGVHIALVFLMAHVAAAGAGAKMHVILQAGPRHFQGAASPHGIVAPKKGKRLPKASHISERPKIFRSIIAANISGHKNPWPLLSHRKFHIGVGLIVPKGNIVLRMDFLDEIALQDQRFHLRGSHGDIQILGVANHGRHLR